MAESRHDADRVTSEHETTAPSSGGRSVSGGDHDMVLRTTVFSADDLRRAHTRIAHELVEAVSDPQLNAWYDSAGYENADKCAWTFGQAGPSGVRSLPNGSFYNMTLGGKNFLVQRNLASNSLCYVAAGGQQ